MNVQCEMAAGSEDSEAKMSARHGALLVMFRTLWRSVAYVRRRITGI